MNRFLLLPLILLAFAVSPALGQSRSGAPSADPGSLVDVIAPRTLTVGEIGHFRARATTRPLQPVNYLWDFGDGTLSVGMLVSYAYPTPGRYTVSVVARSDAGVDTLRTQISVFPSESDSAVVETEARPGLGSSVSTEQPRRVRRPVPQSSLFGSGGISREEGGYTWVLGTELWAERAQDRMRMYRLQGFRADIVVDTSGRGSTAHRIVVGQFATVAEAQRARRWLPESATGVRLLELMPPVER